MGKPFGFFGIERRRERLARAGDPVVALAQVVNCGVPCRKPGSRWWSSRSGKRPADRDGRQALKRARIRSRIELVFAA